MLRLCYLFCYVISFTPITINIAKTPKTVKYPIAFIFNLIIRLHLHKIKNSIVSTIAESKYLLKSKRNAILASSCKLIPPKMIEKNLENAAKKVKEYA